MVPGDPSFLDDSHLTAEEFQRLDMELFNVLRTYVTKCFTDSSSDKVDDYQNDCNILMRCKYKNRSYMLFKRTISRLCGSEKVFADHHRKHRDALNLNTMHWRDSLSQGLRLPRFYVGSNVL